jgi:putative membrane protein
MSLPIVKTLDTGTRLAVDRTRLAYERTLMAWVRTATSLISFGFTIYKFFQFESGRGAVAAASTHLLTPRQFGMIMITTGLTALALATIDHRRNMRRMQAEYGTADRSVSMAVAVVVSGMGLVALVAALFRA